MDREQLEQKLYDYLNNMDTDSYIDLWNNYNKEFRNDEKIIHYINELRDDENLKSLDPLTFVNNVKMYPSMISIIVMMGLSLLHLMTFIIYLMI